MPAAFFALYLIDVGVIWALHRSWWRRRWIRRLGLAVPVLAVAGFATWNLGYRWESQAMVRIGAGMASVLFVQLAAVLLGLLITLPARVAEVGWDVIAHSRSRADAQTVPFPLALSPKPEQFVTHDTEDQVPASPGRRRFLRTAFAAVPLAAAASATGGVLQSTSRPRLPQIALRYPELPHELRGLRILQISDMHVGPYIGLEDIERFVERATELAPDLVVVTGDICDHMPDYQASLRILGQLQPPLGTIASLGNHEYLRGIKAVRACFDRSEISLLVDEGAILSVGDARLRVAGADDPRYRFDPSTRGRLRASVERSLDGADTDAFHVLMSHRSAVFDFAAAQGVHLTLSGHTHGYQFGLGGRSLFERWLPEQYIWGHYGSGAAHLYTSAGVGHWLPFRLGCPPEAPLFLLESEENA